MHYKGVIHVVLKENLQSLFGPRLSHLLHVWVIPTKSAGLDFVFSVLKVPCNLNALPREIPGDVECSFQVLAQGTLKYPRTNSMNSDEWLDLLVAHFVVVLF